MNPELKAKCTTCKKVYTMTTQQQAEARDFGCAMSPCCFAPATVERVTTRRAAKQWSLKMSGLEVYSGECRLCDVGLETPYVDVMGRKLFTGDIVMSYTDTYGPDALSVVVAEQHTKITDQVDPYFFVMGIRNVPLEQDGEWKVRHLKSHEDVVAGEHWKAWGFSYRPAPAHSSAQEKP